MPLESLSLVIKLAQLLMLLAGLSAFLYGAYELGLDLWFSLKGVAVKGYAVGHEVSHETRETHPSSSLGGPWPDSGYSDVPVYRPTIRYRWPPENGEVYSHRSSIQFEGKEMDRYGIGNQVRILVLPDQPNRARLPGGFTHYLWAVTAFVAGLAAVLLVSSLFYLHEGLFRGEVSNGLSLFRSLSWRATLGVLLALTVGLSQLHRWVAPWVGPEELVAVVTGDIRLLPPLLAARGDPDPGQVLNRAERSFARIPWLGAAFASEALDYALLVGDDATARRYLAAMADPTVKFPVQSVRALANAAESGKVAFVKTLLASGIHPDTALAEGLEPMRQAALRNHVMVMEVLLDANARTDYPKRPLLVSAIEGRSKDAVRLLLERTKVDFTWREAKTNYSLADLAILSGMADTAELLQERGAPISLPGFFICVVTGDQKGLAREIPPSHWKSASYQNATLLHLAARYHQPGLARQLVAMGADPNAQIRGVASGPHPADRSRALGRHRDHPISYEIANHRD